MKTLIKEQYWNTLKIFYNNNNSPVHLREISRKIDLKEGPLTRHLKKLLDDRILISNKEANLKKFRISLKNIPKIFTLFDIERYNNLHYIRKNSIDFYINHLKQKPVFIILFGSTAKGTYQKDSDIDLITVFNNKTDTKDARRYAEEQTGIKINEFQITYQNFIKETKLKEDKVIQAGIESGYPIYNHMFYHENGCKTLEKAPGGQEISRRKDR